MFLKQGGAGAHSRAILRRNGAAHSHGTSIKGARIYVMDGRDVQARLMLPLSTLALLKRNVLCGAILAVCDRDRRRSCELGPTGAMLVNIPVILITLVISREMKGW